MARTAWEPVGNAWTMGAAPGRPDYDLNNSYYWAEFRG